MRNRCWLHQRAIAEVPSMMLPVARSPRHQCAITVAHTSRLEPSLAHTPLKQSVVHSMTPTLQLKKTMAPYLKPSARHSLQRSMASLNRKD